MNLLLTGSSTGIGRHLVERLLARGDRVWGLARSDQSEFVARSGGAFAASRCDASDWEAVARAAREVSERWGRIDGLIACAGFHGEIGRAVAADPRRWSATVQGNLDATYFPIRAFHPLLGPGRGKVICFSGGGATKARPNFSAYGAAKTAIVRLVETIAAEEPGLDINAIAPGAINTRLTDEVIALGPDVAGKAEHESALKQKREGGASLERVGALVEWLLSPASDGISGRLLAAPWDPWPALGPQAAKLGPTDIYTLRRIVPEDRGLKF